MKYCPKCKKLYIDSETHCNDCKKKQLVPVTDSQVSVFLCNCNASQREILINALHENNILCGYESQSEPSGMAIEGFDVIVPYNQYKNACQVAEQFGFMNVDNDIIENIEDFPENDSKETSTDEEQKMSPAKRATVRVLSALAIILLFAAVIFGVDYVMALIKNLFM